MNAEARGPRRNSTLAVLLGLTALAFIGFVALGVWQVHRLAWKEALIAKVERNANGAPSPAPGAHEWPNLSRERDEYRRVRVRGHFDHAHETLVNASTELGSGYWVLTPLRSDQGFWVLVNRGFVPPEMRERRQRADGEPEGDQEIIGLLRLTEPRGSLLQTNAPAERRWYSRDVQAIAHADGLTGAPVAPYFIDEAAKPGPQARTWPRAGLTVLRFSNNHLVYAFTWFALAAMTAAAAGYLVMDERRLRRLAGERLGDIH